MTDSIQKIIVQLVKTPKRLFLIDAMGAYLTAFLLFALLKPWNEYIGMPEKTLSMLSVIALLFGVYSSFCSFIKNRHWVIFLKIIITSNLLYCCLTSGLLIYNFQNLTVIGVMYFGGEIVLICTLVFVEFTMLASIKQEV